MLTCTSGVHQWQTGVAGRSPETFRAARVKLGNFLRESQSSVARDLANLELASRAPLLALLRATDGILQRRTEVRCDDEKEMFRYSARLWGKNIYIYINERRRVLLTQHVNLEAAAGRISGLVVSHVTDVVSAPQKGLSGSMSVLLLDSHDADVVAEARLVPGDDGRSVPREYPEIARAMLHARRNLVDLELLTLVAAEAGLADPLAAVRRHDSLNSADGLVVSRPGQHEALIEYRFRAAVAHLLLNLIRHVQRAAPDLHLRQVTLEAVHVALRGLAVRFSQHRPSAARRIEIIFKSLRPFATRNE